MAFMKAGSAKSKVSLRKGLASRSTDKVETGIEDLFSYQIKKHVG